MKKKNGNSRHFEGLFAVDFKHSPMLIAANPSSIHRLAWTVRRSYIDQATDASTKFYYYYYCCCFIGLIAPAVTQLLLEPFHRTCSRDAPKLAVFSSVLPRGASRQKSARPILIIEKFQPCNNAIMLIIFVYEKNSTSMKGKSEIHMGLET